MSEEYLPGVSVKETLSLLTRMCNELGDSITILQDRVLQLERQVRCHHVFKRYAQYSICIYCDQKRGVL
jgi:hypothetical protein